MEKEKILIIDDEENILNACKAALTVKGYDVTGVNNGGDALELCENNNYDLIISDYKLDDMNGLELLGIAKQIIPDCATIIMTAYKTNELIKEALMDWNPKTRYMRLEEPEPAFAPLLSNYLHRRWNSTRNTRLRMRGGEEKL